MSNESTVHNGNGRAQSSGRALVLHPDLRSAASQTRMPEERLDEAVGLAHAIDLDVVHAEVVRVVRPQPGTLLGSGTVSNFADLVKALEVTVAVVDGQLSPVQQRNLEKAWGCKVIDRTGLILEIFGERARTREGRLQVELATLTYQRSRLVRAWTHLERQRGGFGFFGGPGESQLEADRRQIGERITRLKRELAGVTRTRELHRKARERVPYPVVALVGYTNAGKSTLFNRLTAAEVVAQDMLFATLDPTMRAVRLPSGQVVILSDTVGFISDLPTHLIAAFRATLEEVTAATLVLHVRDVSHPGTEEQKQDVHTVLRDLGLDETIDSGLIEVLNKIDRLDSEVRHAVAAQAARDDKAVAVSALTGEGCDDLLALIDRRLKEDRKIVEVTVSLGDGADLAWLYDHGEVLSRRDEGEVTHLRVGLDTANLARLERRMSPQR